MQSVSDLKIQENPYSLKKYSPLGIKNVDVKPTIKVASTVRRRALPPMASNSAIMSSKSIPTLPQVQMFTPSSDDCSPKAVLPSYQSVKKIENLIDNREKQRENVQKLVSFIR